MGDNAEGVPSDGDGQRRRTMISKLLRRVELSDDSVRVEDAGFVVWESEGLTIRSSNGSEEFFPWHRIMRVLTVVREEAK